MIENAHPLVQTLLGTLFTWGLTALGAGLVFIFQSRQRKVLDFSLGFAAGVMTAASYWSLLAPAIEMAEVSGLYGDRGQWAFLPVAVGFSMGAVFVFGADFFIPHNQNLLFQEGNKVEDSHNVEDSNSILLRVVDDSIPYKTQHTSDARQRRNVASGLEKNGLASASVRNEPLPDSQVNWRRILLLIIAITVHNIPEGLAVGVGFGAIGKSKAATFENARNLAFGIGIQNFPEGLAVSLPLRGSGMSPLKSFWYGQLSGMVEPVFGLLGAVAVSLAEPVLPFALAFAAGAMIYVVVDDIIPEAQTGGNGRLASFGSVIGFVIMMSLDVGFG